MSTKFDSDALIAKHQPAYGDPTDEVNRSMAEFEAIDPCQQLMVDGMMESLDALHTTRGHWTILPGCPTAAEEIVSDDAKTD